MTWKLTDWGKGRKGLANVPWRDLTDQEFKLATARYPELPERGYFEQVEDEPPKPRRTRKPPEETEASTEEELTDGD